MTAKAKSYPFESTLDFFVKECPTDAVPVTLVTPDGFETWKKAQDDVVQNWIAASTFEGKAGTAIVHFKADTGEVDFVLACVSEGVKMYEAATIVTTLQTTLSKNVLENTTFYFDGEDSPEALMRACLGWGVANYRFTQYTPDTAISPTLALPRHVDAQKLDGLVKGMFTVRELINIPANDLGPEELEDAARALAKLHKAKINSIVGDDLLKKNFPMIHAVGNSSHRPPRIVDITWGDKKHPKITLVGKGVTFDTGGLDIKPSSAMNKMKKDMGGSAHVLGLAHAIMASSMPVRLRVLLAVADNFTSSHAFRPGDVFPTRKGTTVEIGNTDAEGRLVLCDALTYAEEDEDPELLIDFATLTGHARVAVGNDIGVFFAKKDNTAAQLGDISMNEDDPLWRLPLWQPYLAELKSDSAELNNNGAGRAGAIHGGLYLEHFVKEDTDWVHLDIFAWSDSTKPGKWVGGLDQGLRAVYKLLEERYC